MILKKPYPFDVDDTLIEFDDFEKTKGLTIIDPNNNQPMIVNPLKENIDLLKEKHQAGHEIVLWSQSGAEYAKAVAMALGLDSLVSVYMTKPQEYCDDLPASEWMSRKFRGKSE